MKHIETEDFVLSVSPCKLLFFYLFELLLKQ